MAFLVAALPFGAALAVEGDCAVQDVPYARLADILVREGHVTGGAPTVQK